MTRRCGSAPTGTGRARPGPSSRCVSAGYKPSTRKDGSVLWCRNETPIGSHLEQQRCSSVEAVLDTQKKGQELTNQLYEQGNKNIKYYSP